MFTKVQNLIVCFYLLSVSIVYGKTCPFHSSLWCSSEEIASSCNVLEQCDPIKPMDVGPVQFALYYESLCPDCQFIMKTQIYPAFKAVSSIANFTLIPYGNAQMKMENESWSFECQHGPDECLGNLIETCSIYLLKDINIYMPYIYCIETSSTISTDPLKAASECASDQKISFDPIKSCVTSPLGNQLEHQMGVQTEALSPPHIYVPWVTLNGVHTDAIQDQAMKDLVKLICDNYQGTKPPACSSMEPFHYTCLKNSATISHNLLKKELTVL